MRDQDKDYVFKLKTKAVYFPFFCISGLQQYSTLKSIVMYFSKWSFPFHISLYAEWE